MATSNGLRRTVVLLIGCASILAATSAYSLTRPNIDASAPSSCLVLEWMDPHRLLPTGERWLARETSRILDDADIPARWDWSRSNDERTSTTEHRLRVVLVPSEPSGPGWGLDTNTLAATVGDGKSAPPAVYIFYHSVVSVLGRDHSKRKGITSQSDPRVLGRASRAFGRVVAHEIAHAIAPGEPHASSGLMQAGLAPELLTAKQNVAIDEQWGRVLTTGLAELCSAR